MTKARRPYSRVYWEVIDDPKFAHVWDDDRALATWLRLLVAADMAWPASATLPYNVGAKALAILVGAGLVDRQAGGRYRIHGMDKERQTRSDAARDAVNTRWHGSPAGLPTYTGEDDDGIRRYTASPTGGIPSKDEQSKDETRRDEASRARARNGSGEVWTVALLIEELTGRTPSPKVTEDLRADVAQLGAERVMSAIRDVHESGDGPFDSATLFYAAHNVLFPLPGSRRESPKERKQREIDDLVARAKAGQAAQA